MPYGMINAKYRLSQEEMMKILCSQRHLRHCSALENWEDEYGALYDTQTGGRVTCSSWRGILGLGWSDDLKRFIEEKDVWERRDLFGHIIALYDPKQVVQRLIYDHALKCPFCGRTYDRHMYKESRLYKLNDLFDPLPADLELHYEKSCYLYSGHNPACNSCISLYMDSLHKFKGRRVEWARLQLEDADHELSQDIAASNFLLTHIYLRAEKIKQMKLKLYKAKNKTPYSKKENV